MRDIKTTQRYREFKKRDKNITQTDYMNNLFKLRKTEESLRCRLFHY